MTNAASAEKQVLIQDALKRLQNLGIPHRVNAGGTHIIVENVAGDRIDLWPTTTKWMRKGQSVSQGMHVFWKAVSTWGTSDGA